MAGIKKEKIKGIIIASVVPILQSAWITCCKKHFSDHLEHDIFVVKVDKIKDLISVLLDNPVEVGADRLVNAYCRLEYQQMQTGSDRFWYGDYL